MNPSNLEILAYESSPLGDLCLRRRELLSHPGTVVTEITLDHEFLMSSFHTDSERALARVATEMHGGEGLDAMVGGLGLGYTAQAVLAADNVSRVEVVDLLPQVIDWLEKDMFPLSKELRADSRFHAVQGDVYARLASPPESHHDLILIDVDHSPDDRLDSGPGQFYTEEGLLKAKQHLKPGGILGVWSYAESSDFADALRASFKQVRVEPVTFFNIHVNEEQTDWLFFARD